jgi:hypothetical protein
MAAKPAQDRIYLPNEQVELKFPQHAGKIQVIPKKLPKMTSVPGTKGVFKPTRLIINLKLEYADQPKARILKFDPPIEVRVRYSAQDYADNEKHIHMAYRSRKKWIPFTEADHNFTQEELDELTGIGWVSVFLKEWGDPPIAVGT